MAPNFTPFTGFSYATGLASLGQGLNRLSDFLDRREERGLLEKLGSNPTAAAAFAANQPGLGLGLLKMEKDRQDQQRMEAADRALFGGLNGGSPASSTPSAAPASSGGGAGPYAGAISNIESGGRYDILGPVTKTGDRAYGKYQVMGANIPTWTREILGQEMTPEQFRNNPAAQDAVFKGKFGQYAQKYGPEGAARAWFAGEGGMNDLNRRDQLGTTVGSYGRRFMAGYGGQGGAPADSAAPAQPVRVASAAPMPPSGAQPQGGTPPTPDEIRAGQAAGIFPPDAVPEFIAQQYQREPVFRQQVDQWRAQRGGQPTQVAAAGPQDAAAADAARVQAQGGPRMVLSPQNPLTQGGSPVAPQQVASAGAPLPPAAPADIRPMAPAQPGPTQLGMQPPAQPPAMPESPQQVASVAAALRPPASSTPPEAAPTSPQVAGAAPADMPASGTAPVQGFVVPGTGETIPADKVTPRLRNIIAAIQSPNFSRASPASQQTMRKLLDDEMQRIRAEEAETRRLQRETWRPVLDPAERKRLGFKDEDGPLYIDGTGKPSLPAKSSVSVKNEGTIPPGYRAVRDDKGNIERLEVIPGSKAARDVEAAEKKETLQRQQSEMTGGVVSNALDDIERLMKGAWLPVTGAMGTRVAGISGTAAHDVKAAIDTIGANITFQNLQAMRQASPTGGALGNVTEKEGEMLRSAWGSLQQSQSEQQFKTNLGRVRAIFERTVHGRTLTAQERSSGGPMTMERAKSLRDEATAAIAGGAPRAAVLKRLKDFGVDGGGL